GFLRGLFEPLGYEVDAIRHQLDDSMPALGPSRLFTVTLRSTRRLSELLTHLYVLIPVLDDHKHYWVGDDEVEKLLRHGAAWLPAHPEKEEITRRYLKYRRDLAHEALARLVDEETPDPDVAAAVHNSEEEAVEQNLNLNEQRLNAVVAALKGANAKRVLDLGCGEGKLLRALLADRGFDHVVGVDVSHRVLEMAHERLRLERLPDRQRERIKLLHGSLMYRDKRLAGFDAAAVVEVVEHLDEPRLAAFERVLFEFAKPATVVLTTPNVEYNVHFETLPAGSFRHKDHRFEWTRPQFREWAESIATKHGYAVRFLPVGPEDATVGAPTQMAIFDKR
ncbi:MAG TPA: 3' terminal RNA ribose 2'-O-methyltransferase Hen1, partial [Pyrinomonadaceae bacterium]|nr:3' terminal RNA ribose 2'-O-methyltransferase Hen1 [Pyrinomonadaceae bacterium]